MRIVLVNKFCYLKGGTETYCFSLAEALRQKGHEVFFFSMKDENNIDCDESKYFVRAVDYNHETSLLKNIRNAIASIYSFEAARLFRRLLEDVKPDVIHVNLIHRQITFSILDVARSMGIPVVYTSHDHMLLCPASNGIDSNNAICNSCFDGNYLACFQKKCIKNSRSMSALASFEASFIKSRQYYQQFNKIIVPSQYLANLLLKHGYSEDQIVIIANAIDSDRWCALDLSQVEMNRLVYFGRLSKEKGVDILIDACSKLSDDGIDYSLDIVGTGPEEITLKEQCAKFDLQGRITFHGFMEGEPLRRIISNSMFSVSCSRCPETFGYSVIESFASGTPVIASKVGALPELVQEGKTGFTFECGDVERLAASIKRAFLLERSQYSTMQRSCIDSVRKNNSIDRFIEKVQKTYLSVI